MSLILYVEDYEPLRVSTAFALRQMGHRVLEAHSAESAVAMLVREPVEVLLSDVALPGTSGDVFAAEARALRPDLKIVFCTGLTQFPTPESDGPPVLRKPFTLESLEHALGAENSHESGSV